MGLFSSLFGSDEGSKKAARASQANLSYIKDMAAKDQASRDAIVAGLQPDLAYASGTERRVMEGALSDSDESRARSRTMWDEYMTSALPVQRQFFKEALDYGGLADQERAAGTAVSDVRQQFGVQKGMNDRALAAMGVNPNSMRFASADREAQLRAMATSAGGATGARKMARDTGIQLRKDATTIGQGLLSGSQDFSKLTLGGQQLAGGLTNQAVNRGLAVGQFKVGGTANAMNAANSAASNYSSTLANQDSSGLLPIALGLGASALTAPSTSWIGKKLS
jgi:hypothetical protein